MPLALCLMRPWVMELPVSSHSWGFVVINGFADISRSCADYTSVDGARTRVNHQGIVVTVWQNQ